MFERKSLLKVETIWQSFPTGGVLSPKEVGHGEAQCWAMRWTAGGGPATELLLGLPMSKELGNAREQGS